MNDTITFSVKDVQDILEVCGVKTTERLINKILESKGGVNHCIKMIYLIMVILDTKKSKKDCDLSSYLQRIMPKSKVSAKQMFPQIAEFLNLSEKIEVKMTDMNGNEIITYKDREITVKNVIDYFETKAIERKLIKEKLINQEAKITLSNNKNAPIPIKKVVLHPETCGLQPSQGQRDDRVCEPQRGNCQSLQEYRTQGLRHSNF